MAKKDVKQETQLVSPLVTTLSGTTAQSTPLTDMQGFESVTYYVSTGTVTVAGVAGIGFEVQHSDTTAAASFTAVADADLVGLESALAITADTQDNLPIGSIGYIGNRRYVRVVATGTTNTNAIVGIMGVKTSPVVAAPAAIQTNIAAT